MSWLVIGIAALIHSQPGFAGIVKHKYTDAGTGFSISKPSDWEFVQAPKAKGLQLKDNSLMNAANKTVIVFSKNMGKDFFGIKPTVGVERLNLPSRVSPVDWLTEEMKRQAQHDKYFVPASTAIPTEIDQSKNAARAAFVNNTVIEGREVRVYHVLYVVPSGGKVFLVHMNCSEALASQYVSEFGKIADSIEAK